MSNTVFEMMQVVLPETLLLLLIGLILLFDGIWSDERKRSLGWLTFGGLILTMVITLFVSRPPAEEYLIWGGMMRHDLIGYLFNLLFLFGAAVTALFAMDTEPIGRKGEFYILMLVSTIGMMLMASATDLVMLFLAIETTSIPLYILAGFLTRDNKSTEAGFKYLLFGALTSSITLYGFSLLYGFAGNTNIYEIAFQFQFGDMELLPVVGAMLLVLVGFGFKISVVPLHFWAPDVYEGAPTPVTGFLSTASKAAGFAILMRVMLTVFSVADPVWITMVAIMAAFTMTVGNLLALAQKNIKRMLAYSSIAHAGYALVGFVAISQLGVTSVLYYMGAYLLTNLAAFGVVIIFWRVVGSDEIAAYAGLSRRKPALGLAMLVAMLSLAGMPPFGGFVAKIWVFAAAMERGLVWLVVVGILNSIVGLYYYLRVLNVVYHYRSEDEEKPMPITSPHAIALTLLVFGILLVGIVVAPFFNIGSTAAGGLF